MGIADAAGALTLGPKVSVASTNETNIVPPVLILLKNLKKQKTKQKQELANLMTKHCSWI